MEKELHALLEKAAAQVSVAGAVGVDGVAVAQIVADVVQSVEKQFAGPTESPHLHPRVDRGHALVQEPMKAVSMGMVVIDAGDAAPG